MLVRLLREQKGQILVLSALCLVVLTGFLGLVLDGGNLYLQRAKMQSAVDSAALAGASNCSSPTGLAKDKMKKNGCDPDDKNVKSYSITNPSSSRVKVSMTKTVPTYFVSIFGSQFSKVDVTASAVAENGTISVPAFNYALFAGSSSVTLTGGKHNIGGNVYGKTGISFNGNKNEITGDAVYYSGSVSVKGTIDGDTVKVGSPIDMPDFTSQIKAQGEYFDSEAAFNAAYNGKSVTGPIYVNGDLTVNGRIKGTGVIYASGAINIGTYQDPSDSILFYSGGDMTFNGGTGNLCGVLYAPNGTITVNGGPNGTIQGRMIAKEITVHGSKFDVSSSSSDLNGFNTLSSISLVE